MSIRERMKVELKRAMKARDADAVAVLRSLLAAVDNAEAVDVPDAPDVPVPVQGHTPDVPRRALSEDDVFAIVQREVQEHRAAAADYARLGRDVEAARLHATLNALAPLLDP